MTINKKSRAIKGVGNIINRMIRVSAMVVALLTLMFGSMSVYALSETFHAPTSRLASGKWVKVKVGQTGMYFISNAELQKLGFSQPEKVRVYGFGGRMLGYELNEKMADDLPAAPCISTDGGLLFYGVDYVKWQAADISSKLDYEHKQHPYAEESWYFLSDEPESESIAVSEIEAPTDLSSPITSFTERIIHETDLAYPYMSGRRAYGEDFRLTPSQTFRFSLPGNVGNTVGFQVFFGANVSSGSSSLTFSANGTQLPSETTDVLRGISGTGVFVVNTMSEKIADVSGENLTIGIDYKYTGVLSFARLDYIQVEYERALELKGGELCFYGWYEGDEVLSIAGCDASTIIWDVTEPHSPVRVNTRMENGRLYMKPGRGYSEFVAFNPSGVSGKIVEQAPVSNQDIHSMDAPDMVIISPREYMDASKRIADLHIAEGMNVVILTPEEIYNEFSSGTPDVTAFRRLLKMWYDRSGGKGKSPLRYCMIMSRPTYDNKMVTASVKGAGYPRVPVWQSPTEINSGCSDSASFSTDAYIGMLDDVTADYAFNIGSSKMQVSVARVPLKSEKEANIFADKICSYNAASDYGFWRNTVLLIADDQDKANHLTQSEDVYAGMRSGEYGKNMAYERLYFDSYPLSYTGTGASYPEVHTKLLSKFKEGVGLINYIGHANPREWSHEGVLSWTDITSLSNERLPFLYAATCEFGYIDSDTECGAENMLLNPGGGVISTIVPARSVYINSNGIQSSAMSKIIYNRDNEGKPKRLGDIYLETLNSVSSDNRLRYFLMGDPALRLPGGDRVVKVTHVAGVDVTDMNNEMPEIKARQTVEISGVITDAEDNPTSDYNGTLQLKLYDAETVIETYGNGSDGVKKVYNDRATMLATTTTKVVDGKWKATVTLPTEIVNNYSPGQIICYACTDDGREANGGCERFYVYGSDANVTDDLEGPEITDFYLNTRNFNDNDVINRTPVLFARLSDPSGIKLSNAGVGRRLSLTVDNNVYTDLDIYYTPDPDDGNAGTLVYPIAELEPGAHKLSLVAWDNADNASVAELNFNVGAATNPTIFSLTTDVNPAKTGVVFTVSVDRPLTKLACTIEVFDLNGRLVWSGSGNSVTDMSSRINTSWNLNDKAGHRVPRGIYLYRAIVTAPEGTHTTATEKLAVAAP